MQTIYATAHTSNFTVVSNTLINSTLPPIAKAVLQYLISKPKDWRLNKQSIKKTLGISAYAVQRGITILRNLGYLIFERLKTGYGIWNVYDSPQTCVVKPSVEIPTQDNQTVLLNTELIQKTEYNYTAPEKEQLEDNIVVVSSVNDLEYPKQLTPVQHKQCKHIIKKCVPTLQQAVLTALAYAMIANKVKCPPAYLSGLITRANAGLFEPTAPESAQQNKQLSLNERLAKQKKEREQAQNRLKVDNASFFAMMHKQYGNKVIIPV